MTAVLDEVQNFHIEFVDELPPEHTRDVRGREGFYPQLNQLLAENDGQWAAVGEPATYRRAYSRAKYYNGKYGTEVIGSCFEATIRRISADEDLWQLYIRHNG